MTGAYIALLRGINVSGTNKLPMKQLVSIAESLGLENCRTYIQSGNLVFDVATQDADGLEEKLSSAIEADCGFRPPVMIRSAAAWQSMIDLNPYAAEASEAPKTVHAFLLAVEPDEAKLGDLRSRDFGNDRWHLGEGVIYLHLPDGLGRSKLATSVERILKIPMTARNWQTVLQLAALCA